MSLTSRIVAALFAGSLALFLLKALGVPFWRTWDTGDQCDGFLSAFCLTLILTVPRGRK